MADNDMTDIKCFPAVKEQLQRARSISEVCDYLEARQVACHIVSMFRHNKIDGDVVNNLADSSLASLGLVLGDLVMLKQYCAFLSPPLQLSQELLSHASTISHEVNVSHAPFSQDTVSHTPFSQEAVSHAPFSQEAVSHAPFSQEAVPHTPFSQEAVSHTPFSQEAVSHTPFSQEAVSHAPFSQETVSHTPLSDEQPFSNCVDIKKEFEGVKRQKMHLDLPYTCTFKSPPLLLSHTKRKQVLLNLPYTSCVQSQQLNSDKRKIGRPKQSKRCVMFGLRYTTKHGHFGERAVKLIRAPLGGKNLLSLQLPVEENYAAVFNIVKETFFPNGENKVVGKAIDYNLEIVNSHNQNVQECLSRQFTVSEYVCSQKIVGSIKLYLLCTVHKTLRS